MRGLIAKRLTEDRADRLEKIEIAKNKTKSEAILTGAMGSGRMYIYINENIKHGLGDYIDQCAKFIYQVTSSTFPEYANDLLNAANKLKEEALAKLDHEIAITSAFPGNSDRVVLRHQLGPALDKIIERKLEDFKLGIIEGSKMNPPVGNVAHNTVNIINSNISNAVLTITQSGKDSISKEVAQKINDILKSDEIKKLPEETQLEVLDHAETVVSELNKTTPDSGKVHRALKRLGSFLRQTGTEIAAKLIAEITVAWAGAHGI